MTNLVPLSILLIRKTKQLIIYQKRGSIMFKRMLSIMFLMLVIGCAENMVQPQVELSEDISGVYILQDFEAYDSYDVILQPNDSSIIQVIFQVDSVWHCYRHYGAYELNNDTVTIHNTYTYVEIDKEYYIQTTELNLETVKYAYDPYRHTLHYEDEQGSIIVFQKR